MEFYGPSEHHLIYRTAELSKGGVVHVTKVFDRTDGKAMSLVWYSEMIQGIIKNKL